MQQSALQQLQPVAVVWHDSSGSAPGPQHCFACCDLFACLLFTFYCRAAQQGAVEPYYSSPETAINRRRPAGSKTVVKKRGPRLEVDIPPSGFT